MKRSLTGSLMLLLPITLLTRFGGMKNGEKVKIAKDWWQKRRPEIMEDFDREVFISSDSINSAAQWRPHSGPNWPAFLDWSSRYFHPVVAKK